MRGEKKYEDPEIGTVTFRKSARSRRVSIRVHPVKGVTVSLPYLVPYAVAETFFKAKRDWVISVQAKQKERAKDVSQVTPELIERLRIKAKAELPLRLKELADRYGFIYNRVAIKHNSTNWGSCSTRSNINLNLNIVRLPGPLKDYILLHELCHLRHHDHGHAFHLLLEHVLTDNLLKLMELKDSPDGDERSLAAQALELARKAAGSKAKYPLDHTCSSEIKKYRLV
jgi:predicted metal-dependent hydrolase